LLSLFFTDHARHVIPSAQARGTCFLVGPSLGLNHRERPICKSRSLAALGMTGSLVHIEKGEGRRKASSAMASGAWLQERGHVHRHRLVALRPLGHPNTAADPLAVSLVLYR